MASITLHSGTNWAPVRLLAKPFVAIGNFLISIAESNNRVRLMAKLSELSDAELAAKGLKREDIVHHVFADRMGF